MTCHYGVLTHPNTWSCTILGLVHVPIADISDTFNHALQQIIHDFSRLVVLLVVNVLLNIIFLTVSATVVAYRNLLFRIPGPAVLFLYTYFNIDTSVSKICHFSDSDLSCLNFRVTSILLGVCFSCFISWSLFPLIVSRDSFSPRPWAP